VSWLDFEIYQAFLSARAQYQGEAERKFWMEKPVK
jgi:hypothetical protein